MALFKLAAVGAAGYALWKYVKREQDRGDLAAPNAYPRDDMPSNPTRKRNDNMSTARDNDAHSNEPSFPDTGLPGNPV